MKKLLVLVLSLSSVFTVSAVWGQDLVDKRDYSWIPLVAGAALVTLIFLQWILPRRCIRCGNWVGFWNRDTFHILGHGYRKYELHAECARGDLNDIFR